MPRKRPPRRFNISMRSLKNALLRVYKPIRRRFARFMSRRPHRSFRKTDRRDLPKLAPLPSNIFFTAEVLGVMRRNKRAFITFTLVYVLLYTLLAGISSQDGYKALTGDIKSIGTDLIGGDVSKTMQTLVLFGTAITGGLNDPLSEAQQVYIGLLGIFTWLSVVWYIRHKMAGAHVTIRDALYNSGAPFLSTAVLAIVLLFQVFPGAAAVGVYAVMLATGAVQGGVESMMFAIAAGLFVVLSLYWITSTLLALVIVTLPGTYPFRALSLAGDVVIGRRVSMIVRSVWMAFVLLLIWAFVLVPMILLADVLPWDWLPLVPLTIQLLTGFSFIFFATYVYLLYRRMIDEPDVKKA